MQVALAVTTLSAVIICKAQNASSQENHGEVGTWDIAPDGNSMSLRGAISEEQCQAVIQYTKTAKPQKGGVMSDGGWESRLRTSTIWWLDASKKNFQALAKQLLMHVRAACQLRPSWNCSGVLKFEAGMLQIALYKGDGRAPGHYGWHADNSATFDDDMRMRVLSATVQLSADGDYSGGALQVGHHTTTRERGALTVFPSYVMHRVRPTASGSRFSIVAWLEYGSDKLAAPPELGNEYAMAALQHFQSLSYVETPNAEKDLQLRSEALSNAGHVFKSTRHFNEAESCYRKVLSLNPQDAGVGNKLGILMAEQDRVAEAIPYFWAATRLLPSESDYRQNFATARMHLKEQQRTRKRIEQEL